MAKENLQPDKPWQQLTLFPIPWDQLMEKLEDIRQSILDDIAKRMDAKDQWLTPEKARQKFDPSISKQTLNNWAKEGRFKKHYIGKRPFYLESEILEAGKSFKKYIRPEKLESSDNITQL